jgi:hypothetical protein
MSTAKRAPAATRKRKCSSGSPKKHLTGSDAAPTLREFCPARLITVPTCLAVATVALWLTLTAGQGWLP